MTNQVPVPSLTARDVYHHLLHIGRIPDAEKLADVVIREVTHRNRLHRIERGERSFVAKQPQHDVAHLARAAWTEATFYWLVAHEAAFQTLRPFVPAFEHYDDGLRLLVLELVRPAVDLHAQALADRGPLPRALADAGEAFGLLHGPVSTTALRTPARRLFAPTLPWIATIDDARACPFRPTTAAGAALLGHVQRAPSLVRPLAALRTQWRASSIIHGDTKWPNLLVVANDVSPCIRLIDWELAGLGDPAWDLAGFLCAAMTFAALNDRVIPAELPASTRRSFAPLWHGHARVAPRSHAEESTLRRRTFVYAGARLVQFCLESADQAGVVGTHLSALLELAAFMLATPEAADAWMLEP